MTDLHQNANVAKNKQLGMIGGALGHFFGYRISTPPPCGPPTKSDSTNQGGFESPVLAVVGGKIGGAWHRTSFGAEEVWGKPRGGGQAQGEGRDRALTGTPPPALSDGVRLGRLKGQGAGGGAGLTAGGLPAIPGAGPSRPGYRKRAGGGVKFP